MSILGWIGLAIAVLIATFVGYLAWVWYQDEYKHRKYYIREYEVVDLARRFDVFGLAKAFDRPQNPWDRREFIVAALGNLARDGRVGVDFRQEDMVAALQSVIARCRTLNDGGTYRENCIEHAEMILRRYR